MEKSTAIVLCIALALMLVSPRFYARVDAYPVRLSSGVRQAAEDRPRAESELASSSVLTSLVVGTNDGKVRLLHLSGLSSPESIWTQQLPGNQIQKLLSIDMDRDSCPEILVGCSNGYLYCLDSATGGKLWNHSSPWSGFVVWQGLFVEDFDSDDYPEVIAVSEHTSGTNKGGIVVLEHDGSEKCNFPTPIASGHNGNGPDGVAMSDWDDDGIMDVVCAYGDALYPESQPRVQVISFATGTGVVLQDFTHTFTSSGVTSMLSADLDKDSEPEFVTAGWSCPVAAFDTAGTLLWSNPASGGSADRVIMHSTDIDGLGNDAVVIGTGAYSNTNGLYVYITYPSNGSGMVSPIPLSISASSFRPYAIADMDNDDAKEILAITDVVDSSSDRVTAIDGATGAKEWYVPITKTGDVILPVDLMEDGKSEIVVADGNGISLVNGTGNKQWTEDLGAVATCMCLLPATTTTTTTTATTTTSQGIVAFLISNPYVIGAILIASGTVIAACIRRERR